MSLVYYMSIVHGVLHPRPVMQSCPSRLESNIQLWGWKFSQRGWSWCPTR